MSVRAAMMYKQTHHAGAVFVPSRVNEQSFCVLAAGNATARPALPAPTVVDWEATLPYAMLPPAEAQ
jgi:hypothetical protein